MLVEIRKNEYRLYKDSDKKICHPSRTGKTKPKEYEIPQNYHELLKWYDNEYNK